MKRLRELHFCQDLLFNRNCYLNTLKRKINLNNKSFFSKFISSKFTCTMLNFKPTNIKKFLTTIVTQNILDGRIFSYLNNQSKYLFKYCSLQ